jgi:hypothetical protein
MPWVAAAGMTAIGLAMAGTGWPWLRRRQRFSASRQAVMATVVAAEPGRLVCRLPSAYHAQRAEVRIAVPARLAADWGKRLACGPPPSQEPDYEGPVVAGWDQVEVSYLPGGSPEAMLGLQVELATRPALLLTVCGLMFAVLGALMFYPPVLLVVLGSASALIAVALAGFYISGHRRGVARVPAVSGVIGMILLVLFLGSTAVLCFASALTG